MDRGQGNFVSHLNNFLLDISAKNTQMLSNVDKRKVSMTQDFRETQIHTGLNGWCQGHEV